MIKKYTLLRGTIDELVEEIPDHFRETNIASVRDQLEGLERPMGMVFILAQPIVDEPLSIVIDKYYVFVADS